MLSVINQTLGVWCRLSQKLLNSFRDCPWRERSGFLGCLFQIRELASWAGCCRCGSELYSIRDLATVHLHMQSLRHINIMT